MGQQDLTTIAKFKALYNFTGSTADELLLADYITRRSMDILAYLERKSVLKTTYNEYYNGTGGTQLMLRQWPVLKLNSLSIDGVAVTITAPPATGAFLNPYDGFPPGDPQLISLNGANYGGAYAAAGFCRGNRNVLVNYDAGYAIQGEAGTIPASGQYQITTMQQFGRWARDDGVTNASTGAALTKVSSSPAVGQYSVNEGVYSFNSANAGLGVLIDYSYIPATLESACLECCAERYSYRQHVGLKSNSMMGNVTTSYDNSGLTPFVKLMIQPYKRMVPL